MLAGQDDNRWQSCLNKRKKDNASLQILFKSGFNTFLNVCYKILEGNTENDLKDKLLQSSLYATLAVKTSLNDE